MDEQQTTLSVAVGVVENQTHEILISKRKIEQDQGGLWEFPGGKIHTGESIEQALVRELKEELNLDVLSSRPLITIKHQYSDYAVILYVHKVTQWQGQVQSNEGQQFEWVRKKTLKDRAFPAANKTIIDATLLPDTIFVTPEPTAYALDDFLKRLQTKVLEKGIKLIQYRSKNKQFKHHANWIEQISALCKKYDCSLIVNDSITYESFEMLNGLHLTSASLHKYNKRPIAYDKRLMVSCHNETDINKAEQLNADAIVLGSVKPTDSHPDGLTLGWREFNRLTQLSNIPIYAIGGMELSDKSVSWQQGAQGIAMISGLWDSL